MASKRRIRESKHRRRNCGLGNIASSKRRSRIWWQESLEERIMLDGEASFGAPPTVLTLTDDSFWGLSAAGASGNASTFSADGQLIAFESEAGNLTTNDFNGLQDVFVRDLGTGAVTLVSAG